MSAVAAPAPTAPPPAAPPAPRRGRGLLLLAWAALALLLAVHLPPFLCLGLDSDISMYDLLARRVMLGDVHYRDLLETNFPGIVWVHMAVRTLAGWRSEALRAVDITIVAAATWLLVRWLPRSAPAWGRVALAAALLAFYLSTTEWCHCQRDTWMLLPALVALDLRARQAARLARPDTPARRLAGWAFAEGAVWAAACWIKPFVAVPALACWLLTAWQARRAPGGPGRLALDFAALLAAG